MKRIVYFAALILTLCCGWSVGFKSSPTAHDITFATNTLRPTPSASPTPFVMPQMAAYEEAVPMQALTSGEIVLIVVMIAAFVALGFTMTKLVELAKALRDAVPVEIARMLYVNGRQGMLELDQLVGGSPNKIDDAAWAVIRPRVEELITIINTRPAPPPEPPAAG